MAGKVEQAVDQMVGVPLVWKEHSGAPLTATEARQTGVGARFDAGHRARRHGCVLCECRAAGRSVTEGQAFRGTPRVLQARAVRMFMRLFAGRPWRPYYSIV